MVLVESCSGFWPWLQLRRQRGDLDALPKSGSGKSLGCSRQVVYEPQSAFQPACSRLVFTWPSPFIPGCPGSSATRNLGMRSCCMCDNPTRILTVGGVVSLVVKKWAAAAGLETTGLAGHSLRSGLATSAAAAGVPERAIMAQAGHRSLTTLRKYIRSGSLFLENAAAKVGL